MPGKPELSASMPWVKLYTEMLDDPKFGRLPESAQLTFVKLLLMAGECDREGFLTAGDKPMTVTEIAWRMRKDENAVGEDMAMLTKACMLAEEDGAFFLVHFSDRQGRSQMEQREMWRERQARHRANVITDIPIVTPLSPVTFPLSPVSHAIVTPAEEEEEGEGDKEKELKERAASFSSEQPETTETAAAPALAAQGKPKKGGDPRVNHPAIVAFRQVTHNYPVLGARDAVIEHLGETPDMARLQKCFEEWSIRGYKPVNLVWLTEWYAKGIPPPPGRNGSRTEPPDKRNRPVKEF